MNPNELLLNGFPKTGNHALQKACELLGFFGDVGHITYALKNDPNLKKWTKCIFIKRDPRNILLSWMRFKHLALDQGVYISCFRKFDYDSLVKEMGDYAGWLTDPNTLVISYEELTGSDAGMKKIAEFLGVPYLDNFSKLEGLTKTYHKVHSDYNTIWTPYIGAIWKGEGGEELLKRWGY